MLSQKYSDMEFNFFLTVGLVMLVAFFAFVFIQTYKMTSSNIKLTQEVMVTSSTVRREQTGNRIKSDAREYGDLIEVTSKPVKVMGETIETGEYRAGVNKGLITEKGYKYD